MCLFFWYSTLALLRGEKDIHLFDCSYYSNGTNAENLKLTVTLARNTMTPLHMRRIVNVQLRITSGTLSCFSLSFHFFCIRLTFFEFLYSDFNFIRQGDDCVAVGPEPVPAGVCNSDDPNQMYKGSSGWRKVPGNTCVGGIRKDEKVDKKCSMGMYSCSVFGYFWTLIWLQLAQPPEGNVVHQTVGFLMFLL